jgi:hypothetical protein
VAGLQQLPRCSAATKVELQQMQQVPRVQHPFVLCIGTTDNGVQFVVIEPRLLQDLHC